MKCVFVRALYLEAEVCSCILTNTLVPHSDDGYVTSGSRSVGETLNNSSDLLTSSGMIHDYLKVNGSYLFIINKWILLATP